MAEMQGVVDNDVACGHCRDFAYLVRHENHSAASFERFNDFIYPALKFFVKVAQRLIEHKQVGFRNQCTPQ